MGMQAFSRQGTRLMENKTINPMALLLLRKSSTIGHNAHPQIHFNSLPFMPALATQWPPNALSLCTESPIPPSLQLRQKTRILSRSGQSELCPDPHVASTTVIKREALLARS